MLLVVLYGFECIDRRAARANLAISVVVATYASGFRVDGQLGWWLAAWFASSWPPSSPIAAAQPGAQPL